MFKARASVLILATLAPASLGQATYISQDRWISAIDCQQNPPQTITAPDFGPFDKSILTGFTYSSAKQTSTLEPWLIKAKGSGHGGKQNGCVGQGNSFCSVAIVIDKPTAWKLNGSMYVGCSGNGFWKLSGPGVNIVYEKKYPESGPVPLNESGVLDSGTYVLAVEVGAGGGQPGGCSSFFDFEFALSDICNPDCDGSGSLDIDDFICFQTLYAIGDPKADCDGDGQLLIDDFLCFQTLYAIGC